MSGWSNQVVVARRVIIEGTNDALFVYNGIPALGTLQVSVTSLSFTGTDPYGNAVLPGVTFYQISGASGNYVAANSSALITNYFTAPTMAGPWTFIPGATLAFNDLTSTLAWSGPFGVLGGLLTASHGATITGSLTVDTNLVFLPPSGDISGATDTAAINGLFAAGTQIQMIPGVYYINNGLNPIANSYLGGAGRDATAIRQTSSAHTGFSWTGVNGVTLENFTLVGPSAGTANGISASGSPMDFVTLRNVKVQSFGGSGVNLGGGIVSRLEGVVSELNGANGISLFSSPTSTVLDNCYANANTGAGYRLATCHYVVANGCACDNNTGGGWILSQCAACTLNSCGAEFNTGTTEQVLLTGGNGNVINGMFIDGTSVTSSVHVASGETLDTLTGLVEVSPGAGATAFITTDAGTSCVVINDKHTTANSWAAGTAQEILPTGNVLH